MSSTNLFGTSQLPGGGPAASNMNSNSNMNLSMPNANLNASADMASLFAALNQGQIPETAGNAADTSLALPTPEGFTAWEQVLGSFNDMELSQDNNAANSVNSMLEELDDEELIELPRVSPTLVGAAGGGTAAAGAFGDLFAVKSDPGAGAAQAIVPTGGMFGDVVSMSMPTSPALGGRRAAPALLAPTAADMAAARSGASSPSSMFDFAASLDAIPRRLDKDVGPNALVPYTGGQAQAPAPAGRDAMAMRALTASAAQWEGKYRADQQGSAIVPLDTAAITGSSSYPDRIEDLTETQLASIDRKALVAMMAAAKYTDKQKADVKRKRRLYKNRISAKGAITKKKKEQRSLTMVNTHLMHTVEQLQKQNHALQHTNKQLEQNFSAAQQLARQRDHEKAQYEQKIAQLTAMLKQLDPSAETA